MAPNSSLKRAHLTITSFAGLKAPLDYCWPLCSGRLVATKLAKGLELLDEIVGEGLKADKGAVVIYNARFFLRKGDEVTRDAEIISSAREQLRARNVDGVKLIDHVIELGRRKPIGGVEKSL